VKATALLACLALAACGAPETARQEPLAIALPPMKTFTRAAPNPPRGSNARIARDFLDLTFFLENGDALPVFSRFEGPVTIAIDGAAPASLGPDLDRLVARLRHEAGIDITRVSAAPAMITVVPVTRGQIRRAAPTAACFVRPNVSSWGDYTRRKNDPSTAWTSLTERRRMAVFLPTDVSPQEMRDCLHEEIAQALGPVNDLYRLPESIFNDDNFNTVLTGFDMLILRATYDRALHSGMTEGQVAARIPGILNRLNPAGASQGIAPPIDTPRDWRNAVEAASVPVGPRAARLTAARRAVRIAEGFGAQDTRRAFSDYLLGRLLVRDDPADALDDLLAAGRIYHDRPDTAIQEAHVALQIAAFQLSSGHADEAIALVDDNLPVARQAEHATLLALLLMVKAESLAVLGRTAEAGTVQQEALAWARYGFRDSTETRDRIAELQAISPRTAQTAGRKGPA